MFYNIKIKQQGEKAGAWKGLSIPYYIYTRAREVKGGIHMGYFFAYREKCFFLTGEKLLEGKGEKYNR
jgi:hypothetical protein